MTTATTTLLIAKYFGGQGASQVSRLAPIWRSGGEWLLKSGASKGNRLSTTSATTRNTSK